MNITHWDTTVHKTDVLDQTPISPVTGKAIFTDRDGAPLTMRRYNELLENDGYCVVEQTFGEGVVVSTVWTGVDLSLGTNPLTPSLIFDSIVFKGGLEVEKLRTATETGARAAHATLCTKHGVQ